MDVPSSNLGYASPPPSLVHKTDELTNFYKSIKRDKTQFTRLKNDEYIDTWNHSFISTTRTQAFADVLDSTYIPDANNFMACKLWTAKQEYMFDVFDYILLTDVYKDLVRKYQDTSDAQAIYRELEHFRKNSTAADLKSSEKMEYLTSVYFDDKWTQGAVAFILHWNNQVCTYNELKPSDIISDSVKMSLLQKSIKGVDDLRRVYTTASTLASQLGNPITFQSYYDLLTDAATTHDNENISTKGNRGR